ncbi:MAG: LysM peptidoglycan-binding domain-containing protein [bacterium]|nr:LysM peptidoglycan-binding domain-containing protein [bacterium]
MKTKNISKISLGALFVILITPQIALAAWWNPFTWSIFNWHRAPVVDIVPVQDVTTTPTTPDVETKENTAPGPAVVATSSNKKTDSVVKIVAPAIKTPKTPLSTSTAPVVETVTATSTPAAVVVVPKPVATSTVTYAVREGDSLASIAQMFDVPLDDVLKANNLASSSILSAWQSLTILDVKEGTPALLLTQTPVNYAAISAIDTFLASSTMENLKMFCANVSKIPGRSTKKILNDGRTDFVSVSLSAYADFTSTRWSGVQGGVCDTATSTSWHWTSYDPSYVLSFLPTDSDSIRTYRINYNNTWKGLSKYRLIGWKETLSSEMVSYLIITLSTPNIAAEAKISYALNPPRKNLSTEDYQKLIERLKNNLSRESGVTFFLPEKLLCDARRNYGDKGGTC